MLGVERQQAIKEKLIGSEQTISANQFAKMFHVSRQTIVGDVALLRAAGEAIDSTPQGYRYQLIRQFSRIVVVQHTNAQVAAELMTLVEAGVSVKDVQVEHPIYGLLKGELAINSQSDVNHFMKKFNQTDGQLLSTLTNGLHMHTLTYDDENQFDNAMTQLQMQGILYQG